MTSTVETAVLAGGNEMGELMRAYDWASSPLGPVHSWPQSLRAALSILGTASAVTRTDSEAVTDAGRVLDRNPSDVPFSLIYLVDESGRAHLAATTAVEAESLGFPASFRVADAADDGWPLGPIARH